MNREEEEEKKRNNNTNLCVCVYCVGTNWELLFSKHNNFRHFRINFHVDFRWMSCCAEPPLLLPPLLALIVQSSLSLSRSVSLSLLAFCVLLRYEIFPLYLFFCSVGLDIFGEWSFSRCFDQPIVCCNCVKVKYTNTYIHVLVHIYTCTCTYTHISTHTDYNWICRISSNPIKMMMMIMKWKWWCCLLSLLL